MLTYSLKSDPTASFILKYIERAEDPEPVTWKSDLSDFYVKWIHYTGKKPTSDNWFAKRVIQLVPFWDQGHKDKERAWFGMDLNIKLVKEEIQSIATQSTQSAIPFLASLEKKEKERCIERGIERLSELRSSNQPNIDDLFASSFQDDDDKEGLEE